MDRALNYLALARKAGLAELGEEPVGAITRAGKGYLVVVASDASDHTWRRAKSFVAGTEQQCIRVSYTKEEIGFVVGRQSLAIAAVTDPAMAASMVRALPDAPKHAANKDSACIKQISSCFIISSSVFNITASLIFRYV